MSKTQTKRQTARPGKRAFFVECDNPLAARVVKHAAMTKPEPVSLSTWIRRAITEKLQREEGK